MSGIGQYNEFAFPTPDFVAGTDPTDENDKFTASITIVDGVPVVSYTPELTAEQKALRTYKTYGKKQLHDSDWTDISDLNGEGKKPYNIFKVDGLIMSSRSGAEWESRCGRSAAMTLRPCWRGREIDILCTGIEK